MNEYTEAMPAHQPLDGRSGPRKLDRSTMRDLNRSLVLDVIRVHGPVSRSDVARSTSLAKPTVSVIVDELVQEGRVLEIGKGGSAPAGGRRPTLLEFNASSEAFAGIHFGVHRCTVMVGDGTGAPIASLSEDAVRSDPKASVAAAAKLLRRACRKAKIEDTALRGVAVVVPGLIDRTTGTCVVAPNLGWDDVPLQELLEARIDVPVSVHNIAQAAAVAEHRLGAAQLVGSFVWVYVGSGIGAAIVVDGNLFYGTRGFAGEFGHSPVADEGPSCSCGRIGCLETFASGTAIARAAQERVASGAKTELADVDELTAEQVADAARRGDAVASEVFGSAGELLGRGISYLINILNPELVVIGGRVAQAGDVLLEPVRSSVGHHALNAEMVPVVASSLIGEAEVTGAVLLAMDHAARGQIQLTSRPFP